MAKIGLTEVIRMVAWTLSWLVLASIAYLYTTMTFCERYAENCRRGSLFWLAVVAGCACMGAALTPRLVLGWRPGRVGQAAFVTGVFVVITVIAIYL